MPEKNCRYFEFGEFRLDAQRRILRKNGSNVHLTPRALDLLCVMVENSGRVLGHDELLDQVWEGLFVEQGNLKKTVSALRHALGDKTGAGEFITTVPRRGYRFTAPVRAFADDALLIRETKAEIFLEEEIDDQQPAVPRALPGSKRSSRTRIAFAAGACLLLAAAAFGFWRFYRTNSPRFSAKDIQTKRLMLENNVISGLLSPDGNFFCYVLSEGYYRSLWVRQVSTGGAVQIVPPVKGAFWAFAFAPDSGFVYYTVNSLEDHSKNGTYKVAALGGNSQLILDKAFISVKPSPDGKRLAMIRTTGKGNIDTQEIFTTKIDGTDEKVVLALPDYLLFRGLAWSSDSSSLLYAVKKQPLESRASYYIGEVSSAGGSEKILLPEQEKPVVVDGWMPDMQSIVFRIREPNSEFYQIRQFFPASGEILRVTNDDYDYGGFFMAAGGSMLGGLRTFGLATLWQKEGDAEFQEIATGSFGVVKWAADKRIVFSTTENAREVIGIMDSNGKNRRILTEGEDGIRLFPTVSADGAQIGFVSERSGSRQAWRMDLEGRNLTQLTNVANLGEAELLSDGQSVIYDAYLKSANWFLVKQTADGRTVQLTDTDTLDWDVSPDEKYIAYHTPDEKTKKKQLVVREVEGGKEIKRFNIESLWRLRWAPDGKALTFIRRGDGIDELVLLPLDGSPERVLATVRGENIGYFDWSLDGSHLALVKTRVQYEAVLIQPGE